MSTIAKPTNGVQPSKPTRAKLGSPLRWKRADALLALVRQRMSLRLSQDGWRWLRYQGLTRAEAQRAIDDLIEAGAVSVDEEGGVLVVRAAPAGRDGA